MHTVNDQRRISLDPPRYPAFYSVILYCPDHFRSETVAVGFAMFCPSTQQLEVRVTDSNARPIRLFQLDASADWWLTTAKNSVANGLRHQFEHGWVKTEHDFIRFCAELGNDIQMTPPRLMIVTDWGEDFENSFLDACADEQPIQPGQLCRFVRGHNAREERREPDLILSRLYGQATRRR